MAIKLGVKSPRDWGNISYDDFLSCGGGSILQRSSAQFRNNLLGSLKFAFPGIF
jgi:hypothetical protein